jgi:DnaD/phage-associated family protein
MGKFRKVHTEFWSDPTVVEEMTPEDKFFFLYLLTNPRTTQVGIYQITRKVMAFDMGYSMESVKVLMERFEQHHQLIRYNEDTRELAIKNWGKYNLNRGGKPVEDCVKSELSDVKDKSLIEYVSANVTNDKLKAIYDTYTIRGKVCGQEKEEEEEKEEEQEQEKEGEEEKAAPADLEPPTPTISESIVFFQTNIGMTTPYVAEEILHWVDDVGDQLVLESLKRAVEQNKPNWSYAKAILKSWSQRNIRTVVQAEQEQVAFANKQQARKQNGSGKNKPPELIPEWMEDKQGVSNTPTSTTDSEEQLDAAEMLRQFNANKPKRNPQS